MTMTFGERNAERMWVNQPSSLQPYHNLHGRRVLMVNGMCKKHVLIYFVDGPVVSQMIDRSALSYGWGE